MPIEFRCHQCGRLLKTPDDTVGRQAQCPACGAVTVPGPEEPKAPPPPTEVPPAPGGWAEPAWVGGSTSTPPAASAGGSPSGPPPIGPAVGPGQFASPFAGGPQGPVARDRLWPRPTGFRLQPSP